MRDEHDGASRLASIAAPQLQQLFVQAVAGDFIQRAKRLVHHQQLGLKTQCTRNRHPLLHAARQLPRVLALEAFQADVGELLHGDSAGLGFVEAVDLQRQAHIGQHRAPREQRRRLKHVAVGALQPRLLRAHAVDAHAAGGGLFQIGNHPKQRGFAAA